MGCWGQTFVRPQHLISAIIFLAGHFIDRRADGSEEAFRGEFRELVSPERNTWTFEWEGCPATSAWTR